MFRTFGRVLRIEMPYIEYDIISILTSRIEFIKNFILSKRSSNYCTKEDIKCANKLFDEILKICTIK